MNNSKLQITNYKFFIFHFTFLIIFGVYLYTLCPTVSVGDSGEFITTASTLSLAHPPAYPLYSLLGKVFITLIPFGNIAYRINLMSAFFAVLTLFLVYLIGYRLFHQFTNSLIHFLPLLILAFSPIFWLQSLVAEVFTLNTFFAILLIFILSSPLLPITYHRRLYLFSFLFGLGLGNHHTLVLLLPGFAYFWWKPLSKERRAKSQERRSLLCSMLYALCFFLLGFSVYFYLPIRSINNPPLDWGNPETLRGAWRVVTRADYGSLRLMVPGEEKNLSLLEQAYRFFAGLSRGYNLLALVLGFVGLGALFWKKREIFFFLFLLLFFSGPFFILFSNLPDTVEAWAVIERFYLLPLLIPTVGLSYGLVFIYERLPHRVKIFFLLLIFILPVFQLIKNFKEVNRRNFYFAYDYGRNNFRTLSPKAYFIMDGGDDTFFTTAYFHYVEKRRTDIYPFDRGGLIFSHPYGKDFRQLTREEKNKRREEVERSLLTLNRPVFYSTMNEKILPGYQLNLTGILYEVESEEQRAKRETKNLWEFYNLRSLPLDSLSEYRVRALVPIYAYLHGVNKEKNGNLENALKDWDYVYLLAPDVKWLKNNLLYLLTELGIKHYYKKNYPLAEECFQQALKIDSRYSLAYTNLGVIQEAKGENEKAKESYLQAIKFDPQAVDAYYNLAVVYWKEENWQKVVELLEKVLEINPRHQQAAKYLTQAKLRLK